MKDFIFMVKRPKLFDLYKYMWIASLECLEPYREGGVGGSSLIFINDNLTKGVKHWIKEMLASILLMTQLYKSLLKYVHLINAPSHWLFIFKAKEEKKKNFFYKFTISLLVSWLPAKIVGPRPEVLLWQWKIKAA